ncbi:hypothetical protein NT04LM_4162, partial [Listeria monocytogenes FSL F2-208]
SSLFLPFQRSTYKTIKKQIKKSTKPNWFSRFLF